MNSALAVMVGQMQHIAFSLAESPTRPPLSGWENSMLYPKLFEVLLCTVIITVSANMYEHLLTYALISEPQLAHYNLL
jgi:hypothetical protein